MRIAFITVAALLYIGALQARGALTVLYQANFNSPIPTTVVVFKNDDSYKPFKPVVDGKINKVAGYFLPSLLARFWRIFPDVEVQLHELARDEIEAGLIDGELDLNRRAVGEDHPRLRRGCGRRGGRGVLRRAASGDEECKPEQTISHLQPPRRRAG